MDRHRDPEVFHISTPSPKRVRETPPPSTSSSENPFLPPHASPYRGAYQEPYNLPRTNYIPPYAFTKTTTYSCSTTRSSYSTNTNSIISSWSIWIRW
ncbi:MAG: hypothetical protein ACKPKO_20640 [Candidatus Fonsibacter sp.]